MTVPSLGSWKISPTYTGPFELQGLYCNWLLGASDGSGFELVEDVDEDDVEDDELDEVEVGARLFFDDFFLVVVFVERRLL